MTQPPSETTPSIRNGLLVGLAVTGAVVGIPGYVRVAYGTISALDFTIQLVFLLLSIGATLAVLMRFVRARWQSGMGLHWKHWAEALVVVTAVLILSNLVCYSLVPHVPNLAENGAPLSLDFYVFTAMADALGVLVVWAAVYLFPRAIAEAEAQRNEADSLRREAEIFRLRASLEPHFILNTLNAIAGLVVEAPQAARRLLGALGDLLRDAVADGAESHTLAAEVSWLERYAALLEARYGESITMRFEIEKEAATSLIPRLLLQPLVENAVEHGALRAGGVGRVIVRARREGSVVTIDVRDNGPGFVLPRRTGAKGLHIVERRLALQRKETSLQILREDQETVLRIQLPEQAP